MSLVSTTVCYNIKELTTVGQITTADAKIMLLVDLDLMSHFNIDN